MPFSTTVRQDARVSKPPKLTRSERREQRASTASEGAYGLDAMDAGADSWTGRYVMWASSSEEAKERVRSAGFHKKQIKEQWTPSKPPPDGLPGGLGPESRGWYRTRRDDDGWTAWESLGATYRHPSQALAAVDPSVR